MTVLSKYQRLECAGIWHPAADAQRQDVFVSLGEATLVIRDANDTALTHWSLPAVERINPGQRPALYRPGADADELLELDDDMMIEAIRTVGRALLRAKAQPGRLRRGVLAVSFLALAALAVWWLPGALTRHTASLMPPSLRGEIGQRLLRELVPYTGKACTGRSGTAALAALRQRLLGTQPWSLVVIPDGPALSAHLPGRIILLRRDAIEDQSGPDLVAGLVLAEAARAREDDPMQDLMEDAGLRATFTLLTRGEISDDNLRAYAETFLLKPPAELPENVLVNVFEDARVSFAPFAKASASPDGETETPEERAAYPNGTSDPVMTDAAWLRLRGICET